MTGFRINSTWIRHVWTCPKRAQLNKQNNNSARASHLSVNFFAVPAPYWPYVVDWPNFNFSWSFLRTWTAINCACVRTRFKMTSSELSFLQVISQLLEDSMSCNKSEKNWKFAKSVFQAMLRLLYAFRAILLKLISKSGANMVNVTFAYLGPVYMEVGTPDRWGNMRRVTPPFM